MPRRSSAGAGRRRDPGQDQLRRIRHGIVEREFGVRSGAQSGGAGPRAGRIERRFGGGGGAGHGGAGAGVGHRRVHPAARFVLRRGGRDADLRARLALRADGVRQFARPHRTASRARCAMPPCCCRPSPAATRWTPLRPRRLCRITQSMDGNVKGLKLGLPREYLKDLTSETGDLIRGGRRDAREAGLRGARDQPAGHRLCHRLLLHHRHGGSQFQSGALRWRALHFPLGGFRR
jgi:hypothetical protein